MTKNNNSIFGRISGGVKHVIKYWKTPPEGKFISYKEFAAYSVGGMGAYGAIVLTGYLSLAAGIYIAAALNIDVTHVAIIGIITGIITILRAPLISKIVDNTKTKYGKFRPYLIWMPAPIILFAVLLAWIPGLFQNYMLMLIAFTVLFNLLQFAAALYNIAFSTLVQVISPVQSEREMLMGIGASIYSNGSSAINFIFPVVANLLFTVYALDGTVIADGVNTMNPFKWVLPIMLLVCFALGYWTAFGTKERSITAKNYTQRVSLRKGFAATSKNKYFWISASCAILGFARLYSTGFTVWICMYMLKTPWAQSIVVTIIGLSYIPGMWGAPFLIKKFGKKNIVIISDILVGLFAIPMVIFTNSPYLLIAFIFVITLANAVQVVTSPALSAQINDFQQFKSGERMEGTIGQLSAIISTTAGMFLGLILPAIYKSKGYHDDPSVLYQSGVILPIIRVCSLIAVFSSIAAAVPMLFWDLSEKKHEEIIEVLKVRAARQDGDITDGNASSLESRILAGEKNAYKDFLSESKQAPEA
ncbi:MAG: MFS transporter [Clostridiales bacterium]|jgi:lactose/raffinose/galactose permease|nr:MFS transporter [Clostridiales bacterium]